MVGGCLTFAQIDPCNHCILAELEEAISVPPAASLEQIDLALRTFVYFCARYYRELTSHDFTLLPSLTCLVQPDEYLHEGHDLDRAVDMLFKSRFFDVHSDRMVNVMMDLMETVR